MAYAHIHANRPSPGAIAAVLGVHAAIGYLIVTGLNVDVIKIIDANLPATEFPTTPPPLPAPPPPPQQPELEQPAANIPDPFIPPRSALAKSDLPIMDATDVLPARNDIVIQLPTRGDLGPVRQPQPEVTLDRAPKPSFTPVPAAPSNDASRWITDSDYRTSWINREYAGTARFRLSIAANGKVDDCVVTRSTGEPVLDDATCRLITKRARFTPSRGKDGEPIAGSYTGSIEWRLPQ